MLIIISQPLRCLVSSVHKKTLHIHINLVRNLSSTKTSQPPLESSILKRKVIVSKSKSIFENLAFEDWLYKNGDLASTEYLLMWHNRPAVVCGRHQNPWLEANIPLARERGVDVARRASGGGAVYHDLGNLNLSFFTSRNRYNRKRNLHLVVAALQSCADVDLHVNDRDDIMLDKFYKISGTASKLGRVESYHHFTLLHSLDMSGLDGILESPMKLGVDSRATKSVPAPVMNLVDRMPQLTFDSMIEVIGQHFLQAGSIQADPDDVEEIDPLNEDLYPGVTEICSELQSTAWVFGKTPKFSIHRSFSGHDFQGKGCGIQIAVSVEKGKVASIELQTNLESFKGLVLLVTKFYSEHLVGEDLTKDCVLAQREKFSAFADRAFFERTNSVHKGATWLSDCLMACLDFV